MKQCRWFLLVAFVVLVENFTTPVHAIDAPPGQWTLLSPESFPGNKFDKQGPPGGYIGVDHLTGDVYVNVQGKGFWKSSDAGKTFARLGDGKLFTVDCLPGPVNISEDGKKIVVFNWMHYARPGAAGYSIDAISLDAGKTWQPFDPIHDVFYFSACDHSGHSPMKYERSKG